MAFRLGEQNLYFNCLGWRSIFSVYCRFDLNTFFHFEFNYEIRGFKRFNTAIYTQIFDCFQDFLVKFNPCYNKPFTESVGATFKFSSEKNELNLFLKLFSKDLIKSLVSETDTTSIQ